jgi:hypothetical protein
MNTRSMELIAAGDRRAAETRAQRRPRDGYMLPEPEQMTLGQFRALREKPRPRTLMDAFLASFKNRPTRWH